MARALFLRHHREDSPGLIGEAFEARGYEIDLVMMNERSDTPSLEGYDVLAILGSTSAVYDREVETAWFHRELALIGDADGRALPILGICFGAQALCRYFGGVVSRAPEGEVGWYDIDVTEGVELSRGPWFEFHFDVCTLPETAELWATSARAVQAFAIGRHVGVQFHPEVDGPQLKRWLDAHTDSDPASLGIDPDQFLADTIREEPAARDRAALLVAAFLRLSR